MFFLKQLIVYASLIITVGAVFPNYGSQDIRFSGSWKFYRGTPSGSPQNTSFSDASWSTVYLPHTDSIAYDYRSSYIYTGVSWYRKTFTPDATYSGKKVFLEFEAAMQAAKVYVNGDSVTYHVGGYTPFLVDITNKITVGSSCVVAVKLDNTYNTDFPPGNSNPDFLYFGGLYRNVTIHLTDSLHITNAIYANVAGGGGIFVTYPSVNTSSATVQVKTHVLNEYKTGQTCKLTSTILTTGGTQVAKVDSAKTISASSSNTFTQTLTVTNPELWHPDHPNLYVLRSEVYNGSTLVDTCSTIIGIRTISFTKSGGFKINDSSYIFRGANRHQSYPYLGNAVPASGQYRDALLMKKYGFNFVRMSHYVQSHSFVDACDKLGILGMASLPGWGYFGSSTNFFNNSIKALKDMIRYYRNHPSVILYESMQNESSVTKAFVDSAQKIAHVENPDSQMYTCGEDTGTYASYPVFDVYMSSSQHGVRGYSGSRPCVISEYADWDLGCCYPGDNGCATATTITGCENRIERGDGEASMISQAIKMDSSLSLNRALSWLSGDALWTAFDYQSWSYGPLTASGAIDIFRIPKFSAYFYRSQRSYSDTISHGGPMVFIASYLTTAASQVYVFSNCDSVALYLNGTLVKKQGPVTGTNLEHPHFRFTISSPATGTLRADGIINGVVRATYMVITPITAKSLSVTIDTADMSLVADGSDMAIVHASIIDSNGTVMPLATNSVTFSVSGGSGALIGRNPMTAEAGIASILLQSSTTAGALTVTASASGLTSGSATITAVGSSGSTRAIGLYGKSATMQSAALLINRKGNSLVITRPDCAAGIDKKSTFSLCNAMGERIAAWSFTKKTITVNTASLPHGIYFGQLSSGDDRYIQKILR
ncbi:MAG TPA: hypothetical protein DCO75_07785 [Fibrobacteres bacterium]|nr:hypothetical protein [Fibrobacterota bacterium]